MALHHTRAFATAWTLDLSVSMHFYGDLQSAPMLSMTFKKPEAVNSWLLYAGVRKEKSKKQLLLQMTT